MDIWSIRDTSPGRLSFSSPRTTGRLSFSSPRTRRGDFVRGFSDSPPTRQSPACRARASRYLPRSSRRLPKVGQLSKPGVSTSLRCLFARKPRAMSEIGIFQQLSFRGDDNSFARVDLHCFTHVRFATRDRSDCIATASSRDYPAGLGGRLEIPDCGFGSFATSGRMFGSSCRKALEPGRRPRGEGGQEWRDS
jgi:hypothetical protein